MCIYVFFIAANNLVEVYLNAHGTPNSRCPSSCSNHQQSVRDHQQVPWTQLRNQTFSECRSTRCECCGSAVKNKSPGLRR